MAKLVDVAKVAGVSISTVSRVLNEPELVNEATKLRVQDAIARLNYRPSRVARRLRVENGTTHLLGLLIPDMQNPFFADLSRGVEDVVQDRGYLVLLCNSDEDLEKERRYVDVMRSESVDGVILPPISKDDPVAKELADSGVPVVCVDRRLAKIAVDTVVTDNVQGAYDAVEHLIGLGHSRIGFVEGRPQISTSWERYQGYRRALEDNGIAFNEELVRRGDSRQDSGRGLTGELLDLDVPPTALLVGNNLMALGALEAIHGRGLSIPDDVAIVSYDDMPWALALNPPLTAVRQPGYEMGRRAAELLLERLADASRSTTLVTLQPELIIRKSCGTRG
jgi:DNA-binding LacI/PurR family transcriptional regulator